jgi:hypothetical protein
LFVVVSISQESDIELRRRRRVVVRRRCIAAVVAVVAGRRLTAGSARWTKTVLDVDVDLDGVGDLMLVRASRRAGYSLS